MIYQLIYRKAVKFTIYLSIYLLILVAIAIPTTSQAKVISKSSCGSSCNGQKDIWAVTRSNFVIPTNAEQGLAIKPIVTWYQQHPEALEKMLEKATPYFHYVLNQTIARKMPSEIALLPFIESGYNPFAHSKAGASGLWQIMPGTASGYQVEISWWFDGRRDIYNSTNAALNHLQYLYELFNHDWLLALAAYDAGEGRVIEAIKQNKLAKLNTDFWSLQLPKETRHYIPKLLALKNLIQHAKSYRLVLPVIKNEPVFTSVEVTKQIDLEKIAESNQIDPVLLRNLNPGCRRWATNPDTAYSLILPIEKKDSVVSYIKNIHNSLESNYITWHKHRVKETETLSSISLKYHADLKNILYVNNLKSSTIRPNQILIIPKTRKKNIAKPKYQYMHIEEDRLPGPVQIIHTVKPGDTLSSIAITYHVKVKELIYWNQIKNSQPLPPKQRIIIWQTNRSRKSVISHVVKPGENLSTIAKKYHTSTLQLKQLNHLSNTVIRPNQILITRQ